MGELAALLSLSLLPLSSAFVTAPFASDRTCVTRMCSQLTPVGRRRSLPEKVTCDFYAAWRVCMSERHCAPQVIGGYANWDRSAFDDNIDSILESVRSVLILALW